MVRKKYLGAVLLAIGTGLFSGSVLAWEMECTVDEMTDEESCKIVAMDGQYRLQLMDPGGTGLGVSMGVDGEVVRASEFLVRIDENRAIDIADKSLLLSADGEDVIGLLSSETGQKLVKQMKGGIEIKGRVQSGKGRELAKFSLMGFTDIWNEYVARVNKQW